jgi:hypothetical protein
VNPAWFALRDFCFAALLCWLQPWFRFPSFPTAPVHGAPALRARCGVRKKTSIHLSRCPMSPATKALHETLIRLAKGAITAWEQWLHKQQQLPPQP